MFRIEFCDLVPGSKIQRVICLTTEDGYSIRLGKHHFCMIIEYYWQMNSMSSRMHWTMSWMRNCLHSGEMFLQKRVHCNQWLHHLRYLTGQSPEYSTQKIDAAFGDSICTKSWSWPHFRGNVSQIFCDEIQQLMFSLVISLDTSHTARVLVE